MIDFANSPIRRSLLSSTRRYGWEYWDPEKRESVGPRDNLWFAIALLLSDDQTESNLGQSILGAAPLADSTHTPATLLAVLHILSDRLTPETAAHLERQVALSLPAAAGNDWHDGNVNHPLAAWSALILGGERTGDDLAVALGTQRLHRLRRTLGDRRHAFHRQSAFSEYNSPTYTALDLWFLALIAEFSQREEPRSIARFLEERLWMDVALHFHAPSGQFSGPHSRAYLEDSFGGYSGLHCTLAVALDRELPLDPTMTRTINHASALVQNGLVAILPFHLPEKARTLAFHKPFPSLVRLNTYGESYHENHATAGFDDTVYPGGWSGLTSYQDLEFALGTATRPYVNAGHADAFVVRIRRNKTILAATDFRSIVCRGVFNDSLPGQPNPVHVTGGKTDATYLYEEGRTATLQHRNKALVLYNPKALPRGPFTGFRVDLMISPDLPFDRFLADGKPIAGLPVQLETGSRITFQDFQTCGLIIPLSPAPSAGPCPIRIHRVNGCLLVSIVNHEGTSMERTERELLRWCNGFYCEFWQVGNFEAFSRFEEYAASVRITESVAPSGERRVDVHSGRDHLRLVHDPRSEHILDQTVNGRDNRIRHFEATSLNDGHALIPEGTLYGAEAWDAWTPPPVAER
ncbi:MAG: hypothetical protein R3F07_09045 [Opitutaceae bacterium]